MAELPARSLCWAVLGLLAFSGSAHADGREEGVCSGDETQVPTGQSQCLLQTKDNYQQRSHFLVEDDAEPAARSPLQLADEDSRLCDPVYSGFSCVSGYTLGACRTSSLGYGEKGVDYLRPTSTGAADCASQCSANANCLGFEAHPTSTHCEIWLTRPAKTSSTAGYVCRVKDQPTSDGCLGQPSFTGFNCIPGYEKGACRTASLGYGVNPTDYELASTASPADCAAACNARADCVGFEASASGGRCEIWKSTPAKSSLSDGWLCRLKADGASTSSSTTTTTTTTTTTVTTTSKTTSTSTTQVGFSGGRIQVLGRNVLVNGVPLHMKGVNWSPVRKGQSVPWGLDFAGTVDHDSNLMVGAGINAIRTYEPLLDWTVLDKLWSKGIFVLNTVHGWGGEPVDALTARVNAVKDHPAILMWVVGNEWNYNGFYVGESHDASISRIRSAAQLIKTLDANHPVSTIYGELPSPATIAALSDIDVWGINAYRGGTLGDIFSTWASRSDKPMYMGEYGADAWDATMPGENQVAQAWATTALTQEIVRNSAVTGGACMGGLIFEFNDEWWKDGSGSPWIQEVGGIAPGGGPHPDHTFNEEWWGLVTIDRLPRQAYYAYANVASPTR